MVEVVVRGRLGDRMEYFRLIIYELIVLFKAINLRLILGELTLVVVIIIACHFKVLCNLLKFDFCI